MNLVIRSEQDPRVIDYVVTDMDVRTTGLAAARRHDVGVGAPITVLKDVDITAQPLDFG